MIYDPIDLFNLFILSNIIIGLRLIYFFFSSSWHIIHIQFSVVIFAIIIIQVFFKIVHDREQMTMRYDRERYHRPQRIRFDQELHHPPFAV
jgi:hypothetical protein